MKTLFTFIVAILVLTVSNNASTPNSNEHSVLLTTGLVIKKDSSTFEVKKLIRYTNVSVKKIILFIPSPIAPISHLAPSKMKPQTKEASKDNNNYSENNTGNQAPSFLNLLFNFI